MQRDGSDISPKLLLGFRCISTGSAAAIQNAVWATCVLIVHRKNKVRDFRYPRIAVVNSRPIS